MKFFKVFLVFSAIMLFPVLSFTQTNSNALVILDLTASPQGEQQGDLGVRYLESIGPGQNIWVKVFLKNIYHLTGYELEIEFDSSKVAVESESNDINAEQNTFSGEQNPFYTRGGITIEEIMEDGKTVSLAYVLFDPDNNKVNDDMFAGMIKFKTSTSFSASDSSFFTVTGAGFKDPSVPQTYYGNRNNVSNGAVNSTNPPESPYSEHLLPVELSAFNASCVENNSVKIEWKTESEVNNYGFDVERSVDNINFIKIGFVEGHGTSNAPNNYEFIDYDLSEGKYYYRLKQIDFNGQFKYSEVIVVSVKSPGKYDLKQNYPNPFNPETTIKFDLKKSGFVNLKVYNLIGQEVSTVISEFMTSGPQKIVYNAENIPAGLYFYKITVNVNEFSSVKKMVVIK